VKTEAALQRLAASSAEAVVGVLETLAPGQVQTGDVAVLPADAGPLSDFALPAVVASVSYADGGAGGNLFVMTLEGARRLAAAMGGEGAGASTGAANLTELELSAVSEAGGQILATVAGAMSAALATDIKLGVPVTRTVESVEAAAEAFDSSPHAVRAAFSICGEPCRLVQLVPHPFVARMDRALDELAGEPLPDGRPALGGAHAHAAHGPANPSLAGIPVRVWAELGRSHMATADVVGLPNGAVVELDQSADEPIDLYVNGRRFATGRLMVAENDEWAVRIETVLDASSDGDEQDDAAARRPASW
jgi:flagellar motor switch protein FliN